MLNLAFVNVFRSNVCILSPSTFRTNKTDVEFPNLKRRVRRNPLTFFILHVFKLCSASTTSLYVMIFFKFHSRHFNTSVTILASFKIYWLFGSFFGFRFKPRFVVSARSKFAPRCCRVGFAWCNWGQ
jgi:ABC-type Fe3+-siderophore transport system permease subunit